MGLFDCCDLQACRLDGSGLTNGDDNRQNLLREQRGFDYFSGATLSNARSIMSAKRLTGARKLTARILAACRRMGRSLAQRLGARPREGVAPELWAPAGPLSLRNPR